eukprot:scaffold49_cov409-Prasinococcus_capsulatus_cf.AAC.46
MRLAVRLAWLVVAWLARQRLQSCDALSIATNRPQRAKAEFLLDLGARLRLRKQKEEEGVRMMLRHNSATCTEALYHMLFLRQASDGGMRLLRLRQLPGHALRSALKHSQLLRARAARQEWSFECQYNSSLVPCTRPLFITGCGYSGTHYTAKSLRKLGLDASHEQHTARPQGPDRWNLHRGLSNYSDLTANHAADLVRPFEVVSFRADGVKYSQDCLYERVFHQVRHPLDFASSLYRLTPGYQRFASTGNESYRAYQPYQDEPGGSAFVEAATLADVNDNQIEDYLIPEGLDQATGVWRVIERESRPPWPRSDRRLPNGDLKPPLARVMQYWRWPSQARAHAMPLRHVCQDWNREIEKVAEWTFRVEDVDMYEICRRAGLGSQCDFGSSGYGHGSSEVNEGEAASVVKPEAREVRLPDFVMEQRNHGGPCCGYIESSETVVAGRVHTGDRSV